MKRRDDMEAISQCIPVDKITRLLEYASTGNVYAVRQILDEGIDVDSADYDGRTALHLAASEGNLGVVELLLERNATANPADRWRDTPWLNAARGVKGDEQKREEYRKVSKLLTARNKEGTKQYGKVRAEDKEELEQLELLQQLKEEYEIDIHELDLEDATVIGRGSTGEVKLANWRGTKVAAKTILEKLAKREEIKRQFRGELLLLQRLRHPNIVEFLGAAITKSNELVIVTEYLAQGDLHEIIKRRGRIPARDAVSYALDIARGMNYLHKHQPRAIVHRDLEPRNLLQDDAGHLKVADFGLSKLMERRQQRSVEFACKMTGGAGTYRYMAPEIFLQKTYDKSVDVFSFSIIVTEMFEGGPAISSSPGHEVPQTRARASRRPEFRMKTYPPGMKELLRKCWDKNPAVRPTFEEIIEELEKMLDKLRKSRSWRPRPIFDNIFKKCNCFQKRVQRSRYDSGPHLPPRTADGGLKCGGAQAPSRPSEMLDSPTWNEVPYPWLSTEEGSVFGPSDESSFE